MLYIYEFLNWRFLSPLPPPKGRYFIPYFFPPGPICYMDIDGSDIVMFSYLAVSYFWALLIIFSACCTWVRSFSFWAYFLSVSTLYYSSLRMSELWSQVNFMPTPHFLSFNYTVCSFWSNHWIRLSLTTYSKLAINRSVEPFTSSWLPSIRVA